MLCKVDTILSLGFFYFFIFLCGLQATVHTARTVNHTISSEQQFEIVHESLQCDSVAQHKSFYMLFFFDPPLGTLV